MITVQNLSRNYGEFRAVDNVSFEIPRGSVVGLLGHNGAGKTTIMKMITGYLEPTSGTALVDGIDVVKERLTVQRKIGYLPENSPTYPEMTVIDYLQYVAELRDIPEKGRAEAIRKAISRTRLQEKATSLISTLSRGYRQRVGVAQAVLHEPEILILDEPTNGLDPSQIHEMRQLIRDLSEKSTVILSTHILQEVSAVCDRAIIISRGKLVLDSSLDQLAAKNHFILETDAPLNALQEKLRGIPFIDAVASIPGAAQAGKTTQHSDRSAYRLTLREGEVSAAPEIPKRVVESGSKIFSFHQEQRSLEAIFQEVST